MTLWAWIGAIAVVGSAHILADRREAWTLTYVLKPLTTLLIIALPFVFGTVDPGYRLALVAGLVPSLAGDVFLMLRPQRFLAGLVSFLLAHLAYIAAFSMRTPWRLEQLASLLPFAVYAVLILRVLLPRLGKLRGPVLVYVAAIVMMCWRAAARATDGDVSGASGALALIGACIFLASDSALALNKFRAHFGWAQSFVLATYYVAQTCIALSATQLG